MVSHREFIPNQEAGFGYHYHLLHDQQKNLTRYSTSRRHTQLVHCIPTAFRRGTYVPVPDSLVVKVKRKRLLWSTDFGWGSRYNEAGTIPHCHEPHAQLVKGAVKALRKVLEIVMMHPSVDRVIVATDSADLVKRAAWKESLAVHFDTRIVRHLYCELEVTVRALERRGCKVQFWLQ